ncbi:ribonuclease H-like domain-containing protein [Tanacetum coccineum]
MAISSSSSSSSSDSEVQKYSKCLELFKCLQKNYNTEREKHNKAKLEIRGYEIALESLEARILGHEKNELAWGERYEFQNYDLKCREIKINNLNLELEKVVKERDELKLKIEKWEGSSKNLTKILNSQMSTHDKNGLGFDTQMDYLSNKSDTDSENSLTVFEARSRNPLTLRPDISFAGLDEYAFRNKIIESETTETNKTVGTTNEATIVKPKSVNETVVSKSKINRDEVIIEDWTSDDEDDVCVVKTVSSVKPNVTQAVRSQADKSGQTSQNQGIGFKKVHKIKACFVCKSTGHLIKDCDFYDQKSPEPRVKNVVNTGKRVVKPVWDYGKRVNHQNFSKNLKYPHAKRTFNPSTVLTKAGLVNTDRSNVSTARSISTVRPVNTVRPVSTARPLVSKIAQSNSVIRPNHPRLDIVRPKASNTPIKRSYFTQPVYRPKDLKPDVKTFGIKNMTTVGTRAVVSKGKVENVLKKDKWVWRPKMNYQDHVYKYNGSYMLKKFEYGNPEILLQDHAVVDSGCSSHMTGNKAYLSDYEDLNGGFVAFGSDPKGGIHNLSDAEIYVGLATLGCDNGTEFKNYVMNEFCAKKGIKREFSVARTLQQNGVAERKNRTLIEAARTMFIMKRIKGPHSEYYCFPPLQHKDKRFPAKDVVQDAQEQPSKNASPDKGIQVSEDVFDKEGQHHMPEDEQVWQDELEMMEINNWLEIHFLAERPYLYKAQSQTIMANSLLRAVIVAAVNSVGKNPVYHSRTKHIEIQHHFIRDCYKKRLIDVLKIHTDSNVADLLTKGFDVTRLSMDLRMDRSSPGKYNSSMVCTSLRYALTHNPTIYDSLVKQFWQTATVRTLANGTQQLVASIDSTDLLLLRHLFRRKTSIGKMRTGKHNLFYAEIYAVLATQGDIVPLLHAMLAGAAVDQGEGSAQPAEPHHIPVDPISSTSQPPIPSPPHPSPPPHSPLLSLPFHHLIFHHLVTRISSFEKELKDTKQRLGNVVVKLIKKVKTLETALKRKSKKVLIFESEESMKKKSTDFVNPTKASGEAHEEEIRPTILEAAKTLSKIDTGLDAEEEINTGIEEVSTGSTKVDSGGQREGKAPMVEEDIQATHKTKEQIRQEEAGLEEAIKLQAQLDEEVAKQIHLDKMVAKRMAEEEALSEQQKKRKAQVQFEAQFYTEEDWDAIKAKLEANAELKKMC